MKPISTLINFNRTESKATSERADLIGMFTDKINQTRTGKYKPLSYKAIGVKLGHLKLRDLYFLKSECSKANNFSKYFWWSLKHET